MFRQGLEVLQFVEILSCAEVGYDLGHREERGLGTDPRVTTNAVRNSSIHNRNFAFSQHSLSKAFSHPLAADAVVSNSSSPCRTHKPPRPGRVGAPEILRQEVHKKGGHRYRLGGGRELGWLDRLVRNGSTVNARTLRACIVDWTAGAGDFRYSGGKTAGENNK